MERTTVFFGLLLFFISCKQIINNDKVDSSTSSKTLNNYMVMGDSIVTLENAKPRLNYKFNVDTIQFKFNTICIYENSRKIQDIKVNKELAEYNFKLIDWNFDGYNDITVLSSSGSGGNTYFIWNYSTKDNKYHYNQELSDKIGLEIDKKSKSIIFHYRAGFAEEYWDTLQYQHKKLTFLKGTFQQRWTDSFGRDWIKNTRTKICNNKEVITLDSTIIN
jgi:hypothetical protein